MESKITTQLKDKLYEKAGADMPLRKVAEFIIWALESGNHEDITSEKLKDKDPLRLCMGAVKAKAQKHANGGCAMIAEPEVFEWVAEWLGLKDCLSREEIEKYCSGEAALPAAPAQEEPPKPAGLDLGLDDLFG